MIKNQLLLLLLLANVSAFAQRNGKDYALFLVITDYQYWTDLPGIDRDIREIAGELETGYGFEKADIRINPSREQILTALTEYQNKSFGTNDQLLIFMSMHGHYDDALGAIIPPGGKLDDPTYESWITHPTLEAMVTKIKCEHILLALDACYSGTFGAKFKNKPETPGWDSGADCASKCNKALQYKSRLYLTSGGKERTPTQSLFARKWLEALRLRNGDGIMGFYKLYSVLSEAAPTPTFGEFREHAVGGDFVFLKKNGCNANPVKTPVFSNPDPNVPHEVTIFYPGEWFATDVNIKVLIDGVVVGKGTYKTGVNVKSNVTKGAHKLTLDAGLRKLRRDFEVTDSNLMINISYDRLNGKLSVASITPTH